MFDVILKEEGDVLLHAGTGKGKTLSYLLPLAQQMYDGDERLKVALVQPNALLKTQVSRVLERLAPDFQSNFKICTPRQLKAVCAGDKVNVCVIDEADLSLSPACLPPKMKITEFLRMERMMGGGDWKNGNMRFIYSGATFPLDQSSRSIRSQILKYNHRTLVLEEESVKEINSRVSIEQGNEQFIKIKSDTDKLAKLRELLMEIRASSVSDPIISLGKVMIFVRNKLEVNGVIKGIKDLFLGNQRADLIVTTDSMSRGIDIDSLQHVIHYAPPMSAIDYVHRVGRLNRLNSKLSRRECKSFCLISEGDLETGPVFLKYLIESRLGTQSTTTTNKPDIAKLFSRNRSINKQIKRGKLLKTCDKEK